MERRLSLRLAMRKFLAIDLSSYDLKIAEMIISPGRREIGNLVTADIRNLSEDDISKVIKERVKQLEIGKTSAIVVIPSYLAITKNIEIPSRDPGEIREIINLQASRHTPYSREEIIIDYVNIGTFKQNYSKILLVIATRSLIRRQLEILDRAGLSVERVAFAPEGISFLFSRTLKLAVGEAALSTIHIEEGFTDFMVTQKDRLIFIRNIPIGASHLLNEKEKYESKFIEEIKKSLEAYAGEDVGRTPNRFLVTGAIDSLQHLAGILNNVLYISSENLFYLNHLPIKQEAIKIGSSNSRLSFLNTIACLLSLEETKVDLLPEEMKLERALKQRSREIIKAGILVMAAFVLIYCILISKIYIKSSYLNRISSRYNSIHQEAQKLEGDFTKNQIIRDFLSARGFSLEVLTELYNALPLDIQISYIKFDSKTNFSVEGTAESMASVFTFVDNLSKVTYFKKVETRYTRKRKEGERDLADFALVCELSREGNK